MKRLLIILLFLIFILPIASSKVIEVPNAVGGVTISVVGGAAGGGGLQCTGSEDFTTGATEYFERVSDPDVCTDDTVITDTSNYFDTVSTTQARDGSQSLEVSHSGTGSYFDITLDSTDDAGKITFSIYLSNTGFDNYEQVRILFVDNNALNDIADLIVFNRDDNTIDIYIVGEDSGEFFEIADADLPGWYDIEFFIDDNGGTCSLKVYDVDGAAYLSDGSDTTASHTSEANSNISRFRIATEADGVTWYYDSIVWDGSATGL